jgi:hypothetical protein
MGIRGIFSGAGSNFMKMRDWWFSHLGSALFGVLLAAFFLSGDPAESPDTGEVARLETELEELQARLLSFDGIQRRFEDRLAKLLLEKMLLEKAAASQESSTATSVGEGDSGENQPDRVAVSPEPAPAPLALVEAGAVADFRGVTAEVLALIRAGDFSTALGALQQMDWWLETDGEIHPIGKISPLYREAASYWSAVLVAHLLAEPDMMLRFAVDLRQRQRSGQSIGELAELLSSGELALVAFSGPQLISSNTAQAWVSGLAKQVEQGRPLLQKDIATLSHISGPGAVEVLKKAWNFSTHRPSIVCALVQINTPESRRVLQDNRLEILDDDLGEAVELWLQD